MAGTGANVSTADFQEELTALAEREGLTTLGELISVLVSERETFAGPSALRAAGRMDWSEVWDTLVAPMLDALEDVLEDLGAVRE